MILQIEFYAWVTHAAVRDLVAALVRRCRRDRRASQQTVMTPNERKAYQLWVAGGFHRATLAAGWWLDKDWPIVRHGDGTWWAFDLQTRTLHAVHIHTNLTANVAYQHTV